MMNHCLDMAVVCTWGELSTYLYPWKLRVLHFVTVQQRLLLLFREYAVLRDQHVLRDVDQQLVLRELLNVNLGHQVQQALLGKRCQVGGYNHDGPRHALGLHALRNDLRCERGDIRHDVRLGGRE